MSGSASERVAVVTASARSLPALMYSIDAGMVENMTCTCPPIRSGRRDAAIRHVDQIDASHHFEQLARHVGRASDAAGRHVDLAGIGFGMGNELGNRLGRN